MVKGAFFEDLWPSELELSLQVLLAKEILFPPALVDRPALLTFRFPLDLRLKLIFNQIYLKLAV